MAPHSQNPRQSATTASWPAKALAAVALAGVIHRINDRVGANDVGSRAAVLLPLVGVGARVVGAGLPRFAGAARMTHRAALVLAAGHVVGRPVLAARGR